MACPGHHYHPTERGWQCCGCPQQAGRAAPEPEQDAAAACRQGAPIEESVAAWLAPPAPVGRGGRGQRPGRRSYRPRATA